MVKKDKLKIKNEDGTPTEWRKPHDYFSGYTIMENIWMIGNRLDVIEEELGILPPGLKKLKDK